MTTALTTTERADIIERVIVVGDLARLTPAERVDYYRAVCRSVGLNELTRPFEYIDLNGKLTLYARKDCTDQLRSNRKVSVAIVSRELVDGIYVVTARATMPDGRTDESIGAVPLVKEKGTWEESRNGKRYFKGDGTYHQLPPEDRANAMMKAETKSRRRVTLSICGLGWLDETEIGSIPDARPVVVDQDTGEIIDQPTSAPPPRQNGHKPSAKATEPPQSNERPLIGPAQNVEARYNDKGQLAVRFVLNDQVVIYANAPSELTYMENGDPVVVTGKPDTIKGQKAIRAVDVVPDFEPDLWIERAKRAQAEAQADVDELFPEKAPDAPQNGRRGRVVVKDLPL